MCSGIGASSAPAILTKFSMDLLIFFWLKTRNTKMMTKAARTALTAMGAVSIVVLWADERRPGGGASHAVGSGEAVVEEAAMVDEKQY
jgi:glycerol dehydrogenase-like iron-containing ADH family enzyme